MPLHRLILVAGAALACTAVAGAGAAGGVTFSPKVDNPWFPLKPGTRYVYAGEKDGQPGRDVVTVTHRTRTIAGARCISVNDRVYLRGRLRERTTDWYAQDSRGNVWYFGEDTAELDAHGRVTSREGSWLAGRGGAKAGIFMFAQPKVGQSARQEYLKGEAEDHFRVVAVNRSVFGSHVPASLLTEEWTPLEPDVLDHKLYVKGIGEVLELTVKGGDERFDLVAVTSGG